MGAFAVGEVVTVPFPYTDQSHTGRRPAVVIAKLEGCDSVVCAITKHFNGLAKRVTIEEDDFDSGSLRVNPSFTIPSKLLTVDDSLTRSIGVLTADKTEEILSGVRELFQ